MLLSSLSAPSHWSPRSRWYPSWWVPALWWHAPCLQLSLCDFFCTQWLERCLWHALWTHLFLPHVEEWRSMFWLCFCCNWPAGRGHVRPRRCMHPVLFFSQVSGHILSMCSRPLVRLCRGWPWPRYWDVDCPHWLPFTQRLKHCYHSYRHYLSCSSPYPYLRCPECRF